MSDLPTIYTANPLTSLGLNDLLYAVENPGETSEANAAINVNDLIAQIIGTRIDGVRLTWDSATSITVGVGQLAAENRDVINITSAITKSGLSLSVSTWYHVYVYLSAGTPAAEVVTTAPVAWKGTAYSKTGDTSRRYVGSIKTDGSGNVFDFKHVGEWILYNTAIASNFRVLSAGAATTTTTVSTVSAKPSTANFLKLSLTETSGTPAARIVNAAGSILYNGRPGNTQTVDTFTVSDNIYYSNSAGGGATYIDVMGYWLNR